jgi:hypothetical protein
VLVLPGEHSPARARTLSPRIGAVLVSPGAHSPAWARTLFNRIGAGACFARILLPGRTLSNWIGLVSGSQDLRAWELAEPRPFNPGGVKMKEISHHRFVRDMCDTRAS